MRFLKFAALASLLFGAASAFAEDVGVPVTVTVLDELGAPVPTAVVRHPNEADRHRVNTETGSWSGSVLYMPDGSELIFEKGMELELEVSAPGYVSQRIKYILKKRKNRADVTLVKLDTADIEDDTEDVNIGFGRDVPRD
jgi:hypothetical protein